MSIKKEAEDFLFSHYKKFYGSKREGGFKTDFDNLYNSLGKISDDIFLLASKRHVLDHDKDDGGRNAGDYFPTAANMKKHIEICIQQQQLQDRKQATDEYTERAVTIPLGAKLSTIKITDPWLIKVLGKDTIECVPKSAYTCQTCLDSGRVPFYYYPEKKTHVFLTHEYQDFCEREPDKAKLFELSDAICDECTYGINKYNRYADNPPKFRPAYYVTIKKLAGKRRLRGEEKAKAKATKDQVTMDF